MPDLASIGTIISSVKSATDIAKLIKDSDVSLTAAESKLKAAELISTLADVKFELAELQDELRAKDDKINELENRLLVKLSLKFDGKLYWAENDEVPFCPVCYEKDDKNFHLTFTEGFDYFPAKHSCKVCTNEFL
jgi:hypothetical protein